MAELFISENSDSRPTGSVTESPECYGRNISVKNIFMLIAGSLESAYWLLGGHMVFWEMVEGNLWQLYKWT